MERKPVYYGEYLQLDKILNAQLPESDKEGVTANDEMLFIVIHQAYELWFKQILFEVNLVRGIFNQSDIKDSSPDLYQAAHRLKRVGTILQVLIHQLDILETMTPLDFLDFRDLLRPASGFQSIQFKILEAALGLKFKNRYGHEYYVSQLKPEDVKQVKDAENEKSLLELINRWLERMPFFNGEKYWNEKSLSNNSEHPFWKNYHATYSASLQPGEKQNLENFEKLFLNDVTYPEERNFSAKANRSALFIMLYRDYPLLLQPYQLLNSLLDIDELLAQWRYRHMNMVQRMIGRRIGTGGSTGAEYLKAAADTHYVFKEIADLTSFLSQRGKLPKLGDGLQKALSFE